MARSIDLRLQRLEQRHRSGSRFIVIKATGEGDEAEAKAHFKECTGSDVEDSDTLVLIRTFYEGGPNDPAQSRDGSCYEILSIVGDKDMAEIVRAADGKTRGLPPSLRSD